MPTYEYVGTELEVFSHAHRWKAYYAGLVKRYLGKHVLEVGAGIGTTTEFLCSGVHESWTCLEPDPGLAEAIEERRRAGTLPPCCRVQIGTLAACGPEQKYDTILYIDVLEHIADDCGELRRAARHLAPGGHLIVLAPAHAWLFTPFDERIGHFRRYSRRSLRRVAPPELTRVRLAYLDSVGLLASAGNRLLLQSSMPTQRQIRFWDRLLVPASRRLDPVLRYNLGKSVLGVWQLPHHRAAAV